MKQNTLLPLLALGGVQAAVPAPEWQPAGAVTITYTRTFTDYCGCGIPGVPTIVGPIGTGTSTYSTTGGNTVGPGSTTSSSTTTTTATTGSVPPPTVTTSIASTTTTTTGGNTVGPVTTSTTTVSTSGVATTTTTTPTVPPTTTGAPTTTTTTAAAVVTDQAYIDTVLRHHNVHRSNHSANALTWNPVLADIARTIAESCVYEHNQSVRANEVGYYGQNIGAGYPANQLGAFITTGLYNGEVNSYTYYGTNPPSNTFGAWGHFSQIVWKATSSVGCYTADCSAAPGGLQGTSGNIPPYFVVCNYQPGGNSGDYINNVGAPLGRPSVGPNYGCPSDLNCAGTTA